MTKNDHVLQAVVVIVLNKNSFVENDEPPESAMCQSPLYRINIEKSAVINGEIIEDACDDVYFADEKLLSSDED